MAQQASTPPPPEAYAWLPTMSSIRISPDGTKLTAFVNLDEHYRLGVFELEDGQLTPLHMLSEAGEYTMEDPIWASDDRLVFSVYFAGKRFRTETTETRLMSMKPDGSDLVALFSRARTESGGQVQIQNRIVSTLPDDPEHMLVQYGAPNSQVYKVDVTQATRHSTVMRERASINHWSADSKGEIRVGSGIVKDRDRKLTVRLDDGKWKDISHRVRDENVTFYIDGVSDKPDIFYVLSSEGGDTDALYEYNAQTDELSEVVFRHPTSDVYSVIQDRFTGKALGVIFAEDTSEIHWLEESFIKDELDKLQAALPDKDVSITSLNLSENHAVVFVDDVTDPGQYYLYDIENRKLTGLPVQYPDLENVTHGQIFSASYKARDGLDIPAYVTLPPGLSSLEEARGLPFVLMPHGGPTARDFVGFDYWAQFLASRGYGVLQMNFRGSAGYGVEFRKAGDREWGQAMQDDITDGAGWLVEQGYADTGRLAIVGGSYGGYAALMGAAKTPDLYQCAVSFAGVSDLPEILRDARNYVNGKYYTRHIGNLYGDRSTLWDNSPQSRVDDITVPILLIHGDDDRSVKVDQSRNMEKRLSRAGKAVRYVEFEGGDHYLSNYRDRLTFLQETEDFLGECLN
ncbi:peptidase S9 [Aquisalinus flavus]|uniref:Peptidase S9 n=1 Tax=Aquisalinus flavus TaxID=1526572 RepID=A0A8J2V6S1_9PROT|nr:peptidase S9 [Aquisalinus flavus]